MFIGNIGMPSSGQTVNKPVYTLYMYIAKNNRLNMSNKNVNRNSKLINNLDEI